MKNLFERFLHLTDNGLFCCRETDGEILYANEGFARLVGFSEPSRSLEGRGIEKVMPLESGFDRIRKKLSESREALGMIDHLVHPEKGHVPVSIDCFLDSDQKPHPPIIVGLVKPAPHPPDTTGIHEEKDLLLITLKSIGDGVIACDRHGRIRLLNRVAEQLTGWTTRDAQGKAVEDVFTIVNETTGFPCESPTHRIIEEARILGLAKNTVLVSRDGTRRIIADSGAPIISSDGKVAGAVLVFRDITETRKFEEELQKAKRFESLGTLASGIAHDFNNILTGIFGYIGLAQLETEPGTKIHERLSLAEKGLTKARDLSNQLLSFSKGRPPVKSAVSFFEKVRQVIMFALRGSNVSCEFSFPEENPRIEIDEAQIIQVLDTLTMNALKSMPDGGSIKVYGGRFRVDEKSLLNLPPGDYVKISIQDHGPGLSREVLSKVFDPYSSTPWYGSGLSLSISHTIMRNHGGLITAESDPPGGAVFNLFLPIATVQVRERSAQKASPTAQKILIMDDEAIVLDVTQEILQHMGYESETATNGADAVEKYRQAMQKGRPFDLVILDLTVPGGMGARDSLMKLLAINPQVKAVVSSGYSQGPMMTDFSEYGFAGAIQKPYDMTNLGALLKRILKKPASGGS